MLDLFRNKSKIHISFINFLFIRVYWKSTRWKIKKWRYLTFYCSHRLFFFVKIKCIFFFTKSLANQNSKFNKEPSTGTKQSFAATTECVVCKKVSSFTKNTLLWHVVLFFILFFPTVLVIPVSEVDVKTPKTDSQCCKAFSMPFL